MENNNEEMDLISLMRWMFGGVKNFFLKCLCACGSVLKLAYRNKVIVLVFVLIGISVGLFFSFPKVYCGECILITPNSSLVKSQLKKFDIDKYKIEGTDVTSKLNLSPQAAQGLCLLRSFYVITEIDDPNRIKRIAYDENLSSLDTTSIVSSSRVCLQIISVDEDSFVEIQDAVIDYLRNVPEIKTDKERQFYYLNSKLDMLNSEIFKLDSLSKKNYYSGQVKDGKMEMKLDKEGGFSMSEKNSSLYHEDMIELFSQREIVMKELDWMKKGSVVLSVPMVVERYPINFWLKEIIFWCGIFVVLGIILVAFLENRKKIKQYLEEK